MNENYELAYPGDPDFDTLHEYTKSLGDGSPRGYCRCLRPKGDRMHVSDYLEKIAPLDNRPGWRNGIPER